MLMSDIWLLAWQNSMCFEDFICFICAVSIIGFCTFQHYGFIIQTVFVIISIVNNVINTEGSVDINFFDSVNFALLTFYVKHF